MAIPTQFCVTNKRSAPIANPTQPIDNANPLTAEDVGFISGASALPVKASGDISAPSELTAQTSGDIDAPSQITTQAAGVIDDASLFSALSVGTISNPSIVTAEPVAPVGNASELTAKPSSELDLPVSVASESQADIDSPIFLSPESVEVISNPATFEAKLEPAISAPSSLTTEPQPAVPTPSALTANSGTQTSGSFPLNHARILYRNVLFSYSDVTQNKGANSQLAIVPNTWQRWEFSDGGAMTITLPEQTAIDTFCVGAHNLGDYTYSVGVEWSATDSGSWVALTPGKNPSANGALFFYTQTPVLAKRIRLTCSGSGLATYIGYVSAGVSLQMQRPFFNGHQPYTDSDVTEYYSNRTEAGNIIGRQIRRRGYETTFEWQNIDDEWYRSNIPEFKEYAKRWPMFIAWNLLEYPDDVAFGETTGDFSATMQNGTRVRRNGLSFTLKGV